MSLCVERLPALVTKHRGVSEANSVELAFTRLVGEVQGQETEHQCIKHVLVK